MTDAVFSQKRSIVEGRYGVEFCTKSAAVANRSGEFDLEADARPLGQRWRRHEQ